MEKTDINITRNQSLIMRGLAIVTIALHNYCRFMSFTIPENESSFVKQNVNNFFDPANVFSGQFIYNIFSFLGWYGVPVFIFLSGYGLVKKYEASDAPTFRKSSFLYRNWIKLFALIVPGVLFFISFDIWQFFTSNDTGWLINIYTRLELLTFLNNLFFPWLDYYPATYWYFGLTMQLYIIYSLFVNGRNSAILILLTLASILLQIACYQGLLGIPENTLIWCRQNFIGWMTPFAFGILYARVKAVSRGWVYVSAIAAVILFIPCMFDFVLWQITLLCSVVLFIFAAKISLMIPFWRDFWIFTGKYSPFIFVSHPAARHILLQFNISEDPVGLKLIAYIISTIILSYIFKIVWDYLTPKLRYCIDKVAFILKNAKNP